jgi:hypothetical protein
VPEDMAALALLFQIGLIGIIVAEFFLTAQYVKEIWIFISLTPNLYTISLHAAAKNKSALLVQTQTAPAKPMVLRPRLRTG